MSQRQATPSIVRIPAQRPDVRVAAHFIGRIPDVEVRLEREAAMNALLPHQRRLLSEQGLGSYPMVTAEQIHGSKIATIDNPSEEPVPGVDGLVTARRGITLGISVADCAAVWIVTRDGSAGALLHSGKKGTELGIVPNGIRTLCSLSEKTPCELVLVLSPCIRPPCYEVDFAAEIRYQANRAGVTEIHDEGICTACHPELYYSYRREKGMTGRMLATLTLLP